MLPHMYTYNVQCQSNLQGMHGEVTNTLYSLYKLLMLEEAKQNKTLQSYIHVQAKTKVKHCQRAGRVNKLGAVNAT